MVDPKLGRFSLEQSRGGEPTAAGGAASRSGSPRSGRACAPATCSGRDRRPRSAACGRPTGCSTTRALDGDERVRTRARVARPARRANGRRSSPSTGATSTARRTGRAGQPRHRGRHRARRWVDGAPARRDSSSAASTTRSTCSWSRITAWRRRPQRDDLYLEDYVDLEGVEIAGGTPMLMLWPPPERAESIRARARQGASRAHGLATRADAQALALSRQPAHRAAPGRRRRRVEPPPAARPSPAGGGEPQPPPLGMHGYDPRLAVDARHPDRSRSRARQQDARWARSTTSTSTS